MAQSMVGEGLDGLGFLWGCSRGRERWFVVCNDEAEEWSFRDEAGPREAAAAAVELWQAEQPVHVGAGVAQRVREHQAQAPEHEVAHQ